MGYDGDSYYYCDGCGGKVPCHEAVSFYYVKCYDSSGSSTRQAVFHRDCTPADIDPDNYEYENPVPQDHWEPGDEWSIGDGWRLNPDPGVCRSIRKRIRMSNGHCPCIPERDNSEDTLCPCKEFREGNGCHCGLYWPFEQTLF